jgi:peptidoglycan/LPS O-acetylase OafA/YrhL
MNLNMQHENPIAVFGGKRNDDIEILRGVAILLVLIEHIFAFWDLPSIHLLMNNYLSFWGGVDLFFAISGFVIAHSVLQLSSGADSNAMRIRALVSFWIKRIWRLWPASLFWLIIPFSAAILAVPPLQEGDNLRALFSSVIGGLLSVVNIQQWNFHADFGMPNAVWGHYWSLSLEEQFYLIVAPLLLWMPRRWVIVVMVSLIVIQFPMVRPANSSDLWWFIRSDAFAWGVLIAAFWSGRTPKLFLEPTLLRHRRFAWPVLVVAIAGLTTTQLLYSVPFDVGLMAIISGGLVFIASYDKGYLGLHGGIARLLSWVGDRSYAIYLVHGILIALLLRVGPLSHFDRHSLPDLSLITAVVLIGTVVLAETTYKLIEVPARLHGRKLAKAYLEKTQIEGAVS